MEHRGISGSSQPAKLALAMHKLVPINALLVTWPKMFFVQVKEHSVPQGRLKISQDAVPGILTHSPKSSKPRTASWVTFSRPCGTTLNVPMYPGLHPGLI